MKKLLFIILSLLTALPIFAQEAPTLEDNLTESCATEYDPTVDYFPDKATVEYATGLEIDYFNNYKVVRVTTPFPGATAEDAVEYVLVQCGTPAPEGYDATQLFEVPAGNVIAMSTTQLPHLAELGLLDNLIGLDSFLYVNTPAVQEMIASDRVIEVGSGSTVNVELVLEADPDLVMTYASGLPEYDAHPILQAAGIFVALNSEWVETSPLGRAEWLKFTALFYNEEAAANALFEEKATTYNDLLALTADLPAEAKPTVLPNLFSTYSEAWEIPGGDSFVAQLLGDAGANMLFADAPEVQGQVGSVLFDFEVVYEAGLEADFWLISAFGVNTLADLLAQDERYADFAPFANGEIWNNNAQLNANGGNNYYEMGVTNPALILADLIAILHPELLPDHELTFYTNLQ